MKLYKCIDYKLNKCIIFERQILNECLFNEMKEVKSIDNHCIYVHVYLDSIDIRIIQKCCFSQLTFTPFVPGLIGKKLFMFVYKLKLETKTGIIAKEWPMLYSCVIMA